MHYIVPLLLLIIIALVGLHVRLLNATANMRDRNAELEERHRKASKLIDEEIERIKNLDELNAEEESILQFLREVTDIISDEPFSDFFDDD